MRRVNADLTAFSSAADRGNWIRGYLAHGSSCHVGASGLALAARVAVLRPAGTASSRGRRHRVDVIGDPADLAARRGPRGRHPDTVTDSDLLAASTGVIAAMVSDVRRLTRARSRTRRRRRHVRCGAGSRVGRVHLSVVREVARRPAQGPWGTVTTARRRATTPPRKDVPIGRLCETEDLADIQVEILKTVRTFVDEKILPVATELEHKDEYPPTSSRA